MKRFRLGSLIAAGVITAAATIISAPAAHAMSESEIKNLCVGENGTYDTFVSQGHRISQCCYTTSGGNAQAGPLKPTQVCDTYYDGELLNSAAGGGTETTPPSRRPVSPPTAPIAPPVAVP